MDLVREHVACCVAFCRQRVGSGLVGDLPSDGYGYRSNGVPCMRHFLALVAGQ